MDSIMKLIEENPIDVFEEASKILIKIADNVIREPDNSKFRTLPKSNKTINRKIIEVPGGVDCLKAMGFIDKDVIFSLPLSKGLGGLILVRDKLLALNNSSENCGTIKKQKKNDSQEKNSKVAKDEKFVQVKPPPYKSNFTHPFLKQIESRFNDALVYECESLKQRALRLIPLPILETKALNNLRKLQESVKRRKLECPDVNLQDFLIIELLDWFKNDFFDWVDCPDCEKCGEQTTFSHISNDKSLNAYTDRVEMYKCTKCNEVTPFPRYNDLNILMETRKGRCGEWANTFTLFCRAMNWDARYVADETDHVWTEVYSHSQKRWLHCDPCENKCDSPLLYEAGWGKKLSYVIAYSAEDVQDVTWRYTSKFKEVLSRRTKCSEREFMNALMLMRQERQKKTMSISRIEYVNKRLTQELVEFLTEKDPKGEELQGRETGSLDWRSARGEVGDVNVKYSWVFSDDQIALGPIAINYSCVSDEYTRVLADDSEKVVKGWRNGAQEGDGIFRKEESDWKMCYLCRTENTEFGKMSWKFCISDTSSYEFDTFSYVIKGTTFGDATIALSLYAGHNNHKLVANKNENDNESRDINVQGITELYLNAVLFGGEGNTAWQKAQLFREQLSNLSDYSLCVKFTFRKKSNSIVN